MENSFWRKNADQWIKVVDSVAIKSRQVTNPAILGLIGKNGFNSVLDVGCGEGWLGRELPESISYLGIDGSPELVKSARTRSHRDYEVVSYGDLIQKKWNSSRKFDVAIFNFSLLDHEISPLLMSTKDYLSRGGRIAIQTIHPCFKLTKYEDQWVHEDFKATQIEFAETMPWYGRTLASWSKVFREANLSIAEIIEPVVGGTPSSIIFVLHANEKSHDFRD